MCPFSPMRTPKLQLAAEQPLIRECWIQKKKKNTPHPRAKEKPQKDTKRGKITFRIKHHTCQRRLEGSNKTLWAPGPRDPIETETELCLSVSTGQQWPATGAEALGAADLGYTTCGIYPMEDVDIKLTIELPSR